MTKAPALLAGLLLALGTKALGAIELPQTLTPEEVQCDQQQLEKLAFRAVVSQVDPADHNFPPNPSLFLWWLPFGGTTFSGLAVTDSVRVDDLGNPLRDELQLSIDLVVSGTADGLDPRRPLLPQAVLVRRGLASNLIAPASKPSISVSFDAGLTVVDPTVPTIPLAVNNLSVAGRGSQPLAAADARGRGLARDSLTRPCHSKLTSFDERVFRIISRSLRISNWFAGRFGDLTTWDIVLFRGEDPHLYRGRIYPYAKVCDATCDFVRGQTLDLRFIVNWDAAGRLTTGEVRLTAPPASNVIAMFLLPPMFPGHDRQGPAEFEGAPFLFYRTPDNPLNILTAPVDWGALLADTGWND